MFASNTSQVSNGAVYVEDVFQTWLSTGNGTSRTVTGPDMTLGGLSITKSRSAATGWRWVDTARGAGLSLESNSTAAQASESTGVTAFTTTGTSIGSDADYNTNGATYVDYLLKKQPKFFDVVTYTGNGAPAGQVINHNLGSVPGFIICKCTSTTQDWAVCARTGGAASPASAITYATGLSLNTTAAAGYTGTLGDFPTATTFNTAGLFTSPGEYPNLSGQTYVAYLFAHNAGGFPASGTGSTNGITCGSFTADGSGNASVTLGYEPQFWLYKPVGTGGWTIYDTMRGWSQTSIFNLNPNTSGAEGGGSTTAFYPTATGFDCVGGNLNPSAAYIYIAIRRGPMKVPTSGTKVFAPLARTGTGTNPTVVTTGTNPDLLLSFPRTASPAAYGTVFFDKLRGVSQILQSANTNAEATTAGTFVLQCFLNTGFQTGADFINGYINYSGETYVNYAATRAPGFFDEVCYTGTGVATTQAHNLGVVPELMIVKSRGTAGTNWAVYSQLTPTTYRYNTLQTANAGTGGRTYGPGGSPNFEELSAAPTAAAINLASSAESNASGRTYVAYLFASCPGVSKVFSFTGNGSTQTIDCGFTGGARFVLLKASSATGGWYVYDTARGMTVLTDPYLQLNSTAAETATLGSVTTVSTGFAVNEAITTGVNTNGVTYIGLAIS